MGESNLLSGFHHGYSVLGLGRIGVLSGDDLGQFRLREEAFTQPAKVRREVQGFT